MVGYSPASSMQETSSFRSSILLFIARTAIVGISLVESLKSLSWDIFIVRDSCRVCSWAAVRSVIWLGCLVCLVCDSSCGFVCVL